MCSSKPFELINWQLARSRIGANCDFGPSLRILLIRGLRGLVPGTELELGWSAGVRESRRDDRDPLPKFRAQRGTSGQETAGIFLVPGTGLEPARLAALDPKSSASANSAIPAQTIGLLAVVRISE